MKAILSKLGSMISLPLALLLVIFFFLPWLTLQCGGEDLGSATGMQLAQGDMSMSEKFDELKKNDDSKNSKDDIKPRSWAWLGLLLPIVALGAAAVSLLGKLDMKVAGIVLALVGVGGIVVMSAVGNVSYSDDMIKEKPKEDAPPKDSMEAAMGGAMESKMGDMMSTRTTGIVSAAMTMYIILVICGAISVVMAIMGDKLFPPRARVVAEPSAQAPPPPPAESPPPQE